MSKVKRKKLVLLWNDKNLIPRNELNILLYNTEETIFYWGIIYYLKEIETNIKIDMMSSCQNMYIFRLLNVSV